MIFGVLYMILALSNLTKSTIGKNLGCDSSPLTPPQFFSESTLFSRKNWGTTRTQNLVFGRQRYALKSGYFKIIIFVLSALDSPKITIFQCILLPPEYSSSAIVHELQLDDKFSEPVGLSVSITIVSCLSGMCENFRKKIFFLAFLSSASFISVLRRNKN